MSSGEAFKCATCGRKVLAITVEWFGIRQTFYRHLQRLRFDTAPKCRDLKVIKILPAKGREKG